MIGDIIEIARAKAALAHENIPVGGGGEVANAARSGWASLVRMAARLLPVST
jgi:hypothetical protein